MGSLLPRYSVIIPAHNEERRIGHTLRSYALAFLDSEIIVVLNGCSDATVDRVAEVAKTFSHIACVEIEEPIGKGGAIRAGFVLARAPIIAYADADDATSASEMRRLCQEIKSTEDGVIASRWLRSSNIVTSQPLKRRIASRAFNLLVRLLFGLPFSDTQCGAKVFKAETIRAVLQTIETSNLAFDVDLLFCLHKAKKSVREVATAWQDVEGSTVRLMPASIKMLASILRLRIRHSFLSFIIPLFDRYLPTRPMKTRHGLSILILNWRDPKHPQAGGAELYLFEMAKRWAQRGSSVEWITSSFKHARKSELIDGIRIRRVGSAISVYFSAALEYIRHCRGRFDVIIDSENGIPFFSPFYSLKPKLCIVYHVHQKVFQKYIPFPLSAILKWLEARLMPYAYRHDSFVTISEDTRKQMEALRFSNHPIEVVHPGISESLEPGIKAALPTVVYVGRLKKYKRVHLLIEAFEKVKLAVPAAILRVAGDGGTLPELKRMVAERRLSDSVFFEGFVSEKRKKDLLQQAWIFVTPSEIEGWGITVIEANACGTPCMAFDVPGLREAINSGVSGITVPEGADLSGPIQEVLLSSTLRGALELGAIEQAKRFSWEAASESMFGLLVNRTAAFPLDLVKFNEKWNVVRNGRVAAEFNEMALERHLV